MIKLRKKILFTGGGSAGHVTVNLALIPKIKEIGWDLSYIGSETGIEKQLIAEADDVKYYGIATGKLRRYFDWNNVKDPFKVLKGVVQAYSIIRKEKPNIVFSKGGFVSVPVIIGAWLNKVPIIIHESDYTPGLANRISIPLATKVCATFPETLSHLPANKGVYVGAIVRDELTQGDVEKGLAYCGFSNDKPVLLVMGGSLGARKINEAIRANIETLTSQFQIAHICGKGQVDHTVETKGYKQFEYVTDELPHIMAMATIVVSRAGSNAIFEFLSLKKPMLLIPLTKQQSRGDQLLNAASFKKAGYCDVLFEEDLTKESLLQKVNHVYENRDQYIKQMESRSSHDSLNQVFELIKDVAKK